MIRQFQSTFFWHQWNGLQLRVVRIVVLEPQKQLAPGFMSEVDETKDPKPLGSLFGTARPTWRIRHSCNPPLDRTSRIRNPSMKTYKRSRLSPTLSEHTQSPRRTHDTILSITYPNHQIFFNFASSRSTLRHPMHTHIHPYLASKGMSKTAYWFIACLWPFLWLWVDLLPESPCFHWSPSFD